MKKISVVTVVYNDVQNIEKTILNVLNQSFKWLDYVVIDGDSTDGTREIIEKYTPQISRYISESDKGIYNAMNKCMNLISGDYVCFMNSGDSFVGAEVLQEIFGKEEQTSDVIYGSTIVTNGDKKKKHLPRPVDSIKNGRLPFVHQSVFLKTELFKKCGFNESYRVNADFDLFLRLFKEGNSFKEVDTEVSYYAAGGLSATATESDKEKLKIVETYGYPTGPVKKLLREKKLKGIIKKVLSIGKSS